MSRAGAKTPVVLFSGKQARVMLSARTGGTASAAMSVTGVFDAAENPRAFIGAGSMSRSIIAGLIQAGYPAGVSSPPIPAVPSWTNWPASSASVSPRTTPRRPGSRGDRAGGQAPADGGMLTALVAELGSLDGKLLISIAAGIRVARLQEMAGSRSHHSHHAQHPSCWAGDDRALCTARHRAGRSGGG